LLKQTLLHQGKDLRITIDQVELPNGTVVDLEMVHHPGAAAVVPFASEEEILLIRQYRWATSQWIYEIPAGKLKPGEQPESCARRELVEEVGQRAERIDYLGSIWTVPGFSNEKIHLFAAYDLKEASQSLESDELVQPVRLTIAEVKKLILHGELCDAKSLCALYRVFFEIR